MVLRYVQTADSAFDRSAAIEAMNQRLALLRDKDSGKVMDELAGHAALLDALFQRWTAEAIAAKAPDHRAKFMKLALASQASYVRTVIGMEGLRAQQQGKARVTLDPDEGCGDGSGSGWGEGRRLE
jgi:hypothetical protein